MTRDELKEGQEVLFGKTTKTKGRIVKLNPSRVRVKALEAHKNSPVGAEWNVPYSMIYPLTPQKPKPLEYNPFDEVENLILQAIVLLYDKDPNCDGEATNKRAVIYFKNLHEEQLKHLQAALGREVTPQQAHHWYKQYEKNKK